MDELDPRHTLGRIFGTDWTIANVAKLLRFNAGQGMVRSGSSASGIAGMNQDYLRKTAARHLPSDVAVTFRRGEDGSLIAGICFADLNQYLDWRDETAEEWLNALFLDDRDRVSETTGADLRERLFKLAV